MADVVFRHDGVLAQYAGDAIEAFWNAPMDQADHARRACLTALDMVTALAALRPQFEARGWAHLDLGVGINTGQMVVGNMGSKDRLIYTAVGDPVNVAARLEGLSKEYGVRIVVGEATVSGGAARLRLPAPRPGRGQGPRRAVPLLRGGGARRRARARRPAPARAATTRRSRSIARGAGRTRCGCLTSSRPRRPPTGPSRSTGGARGRCSWIRRLPTGTAVFIAESK